MFASLLAAPAILQSFDDSSPLDWETYRLAEGIAGGLLLVAACAPLAGDRR